MAHVLITGHTGFKGSWATMVLSALGHEVSGFALDPEEKSLFLRAAVGTRLRHDIRGDVRDGKHLTTAMNRIRPDYVLHLAAQALVLEGYRRPTHTYESNVLGTLNVLNATSSTDSVKAQLIVTTDKVYSNNGLRQSYVEEDALGGNDPYSASKAASDILAQERLRSPESKPGAIARAGNVIGAGDYAKNRLLPDLLRAVKANRPLRVRNPRAIRPWQHVLDCVNGYLILLERIEKDGVDGPWNFGPSIDSLQTVADVLEISRSSVDFEISYPESRQGGLHEEGFLALNSQKARQELGWKNYIDFEQAVSWSLIEVLEPRNQSLSDAIYKQISTFLEKR